MDQNPSWEANRFVASQEIPCILLNPKVHYRNHNCPLPVCILNQPNPFHTPRPRLTYWRYIQILSSHLRLGLPSGLFPWGHLKSKTVLIVTAASTGVYSKNCMKEWKGNIILNYSCGIVCHILSPYICRRIQ
jgi:hypothetical protein